MFFVLSRAWDKEKFWVPMRNRASDRRIPRSDALTLNHRDFTVSEVYYEVYMTRVLYTARIRNFDSVMFLNRVREMVSIELGKEMPSIVSTVRLSFSETIAHEVHLFLIDPSSPQRLKNPRFQESKITGERKSRARGWLVQLINSPADLYELVRNKECTQNQNK